MGEIIFDETQLGNLQAIGASLFAEDSSDPRSWNYERQLVRPRIRWLRIIGFLAALIGGAWGSHHLLSTYLLSPGIAWIVCFLGVLALVLCFLKRILICIVQIYQRFAPASLRNKCRFEPSCSEYMILSLQKYGVWKGLSKGIDRLKRCNAEEGGFDYP